MVKTKTAIALVDDHSLFRNALCSYLKEYTDLEVLFQASNGKELLEQLNTFQPEVILLDLEMPVMDGVEAASLVKKDYPHIKIIILTQHKEDGLIPFLIEKGVHGFLTKNTSIEVVRDAIFGVIQNDYYFNDKISIQFIKELVLTKKFVPLFEQVKLHEREIEIIKLICEEYTNKEIGEILHLSYRTIDVYRASILEKTGARNTAGIVMYAVKNNLVEPPQINAYLSPPPPLRTSIVELSCSCAHFKYSVN